MAAETWDDVKIGVKGQTVSTLTSGYYDEGLDFPLSGVWTVVMQTSPSHNTHNTALGLKLNLIHVIT